jgi:hypothetical protein
MAVCSICSVLDFLTCVASVKNFKKLMNIQTKLQPSKMLPPRCKLVSMYEKVISFRSAYILY